nr:GGDEF domain-containing protein [uncultured Actinotalea sp.]
MVIRTRATTARGGAAHGVPPAAVAAVLVAIVLATVPVAPAPVRSWVTWVLFLAVHVAFLRDTSAVVRDPRSNVATRRLWAVFLVAVGLFTLGDVLQLVAMATRPWTVELAFGVPAQRVLVLAGVALVFLAAAAMPVRLASARETARFAIDVGVVVLGVVAVAVVWHPVSPERDDLALLLLEGPLLFAVATLAIFKLVFAPERPFSRGAGWLLALAALGEAALATANIGEGFAANLSLTNGIALACNALLALAARVQRRAGSHATPARRRALELRRLPYVAVLTVNVLLVASLLTEGLTSRTWVVLAVTITSTALVLARQWLSLSEQQTLLRRLHRALEERDTLTARLEHLAFHDPLTGLMNRSRFTALLDAAVDARRDADVTDPASGPGCVLLVDLDGFKAINDALGHAAGDAVLVAVADRLRTCVRADDTVARFGGDEFCVLLAGDLQEGREIALRVVELLSRPFDHDGRTVRVGASVGVAAVSDAPSGEILHRADVAMYAAKAQGRGSVVVDAVTT